jgi:hypothetical protein
MELILTQKYRERAFVAFETKMDSSTECPLFNTGAYWAKARMFLKEIQQGYYSDPPGFDDFYTVRLDDKGTPKTDKHGIQLITCRWGVYDVKNAHRIFTKTFSNSVTGVEFASFFLIQQLHQHNICMGQWYIAGFLWVGHYDTWKLDCLQELIEKKPWSCLPSWA